MELGIATCLTGASKGVMCATWVRTCAQQVLSWGRLLQGELIEPQTLGWGQGYEELPKAAQLQWAKPLLDAESPSGQSCGA